MGGPLGLGVSIEEHAGWWVHNLEGSTITSRRTSFGCDKNPWNLV